MKLLTARFVYWLRGLFEDPVALFKALGIETGDTILEIGCAVGYHTFALARVASEGKVYAVDVWEEGLAHLRRKSRAYANIVVMCRSAESVAFPPVSLDKIVCFDTLHEVPGYEGALVKWAEFLKETGTFLYRDPEIAPERIEALSDGRLCRAGVVKRIHIFTRQ